MTEFRVWGTVSLVMTIAVIKTGGKQYVVCEAARLEIEKISGEVGSIMNFPEVLLMAKDGSEAQIGRPIVSGASVSAKIISQGLGKKISVIKFKRKIRYKRSHGHRQPQTVVQIEKIG